MHESAGDEPEEQDEGSGSASGGRSKPLRRPVAPRSSLGTDSFDAALETIPADDWDDDQDEVLKIMLRQPHDLGCWGKHQKHRAKPQNVKY
jgi:hypothetical protein